MRLHRNGMRLHRNKSTPQELLGTVHDSLDAIRGEATRARVLKAVVIAGGAAALTAGSAAVSSLRRRLEAAP
jgi:hypothetical protein